MPWMKLHPVSQAIRCRRSNPGSRLKHPSSSGVREVLNGCGESQTSMDSPSQIHPPNLQPSLLPCQTSLFYLYHLLTIAQT
ncbi:hypothetical protein GDO78_015715 [Eleutherodactylus coqui]|uniref:Uncharacterized protein n=1 Tax=Eleutherodactylus coqui TaxID=57060 RepID=A0A8J6E3W8_ELECQ|nr:hypothetical protein GDO78_015715 [Eleutherodactylus coqui]